MKLFLLFSFSFALVLSAPLLTREWNYRNTDNNARNELIRSTTLDGVTDVTPLVGVADNRNQGIEIQAQENGAGQNNIDDLIALVRSISDGSIGVAVPGTGGNPTRTAANANSIFRIRQ